MHPTSKLWFLFILTSSALLLSAPTTALESDRYARLQITADTAELDEQLGKATYRGSVVLTQGTLVLKSDMLTVIRNETGVNRVIAEGSPASYRQTPDPGKPPAEAQANRITYFVGPGRIKLEGDAILQQGESRFEGNDIEYDIRKRVLTAGDANEASSSDQRVKMVLPPSGRQFSP